MAPSKRKRDELDDSDEDEPSFGRQILPVANLPEDFSETPLDGMQYLFTVRRDARYLPHVTRATNPYETPDCVEAPPQNDSVSSHPALPSTEWRALFETRCKNFRQNINQPTIHVQFIPRNEARQLMPNMRERDSWWAFLAGQPEEDWNSAKKVKQTHTSTKRRNFGRGMRGFSEDPEVWHINDEGEVEMALRVDPSESLPTPTGTPAPPEILDRPAQPGTVDLLEPIVIMPREVSQILLKHIDERMALHLLMYFTHWLNLHIQKPEASSYQPMESHARWVFALLSRVEDHISADDMSLLRNLARAYLALLKTLIQARMTSTEDNALSPGKEAHGSISERSCWIILSTIVGTWAQRDLWSDAESMLANLGPIQKYTQQ